jgi:hypothetical protein
MKPNIHKILTSAFINNLLLFFILLFSISLSAQEWTEPVQVSNTEGYQMDPDMCIDNNGIIHAVWSQKINDNYWKIMYSKSDNEGETWSEDYDVSLNDTLWMSQPHIAYDSQNKLYVTYDYNTMQPAQMLVYLKIFDGSQWSDSILVTEGMFGSDYNKLIIDNDNRAFIGWYRNSKFYYKFYENGVLSQYYCPFCDSTDTYLPVNHKLSINNQVHWIGSSHTNSDWRLQYFLFNLSGNYWEYPEILRPDQVNLVGKDIDLNTYENPELCFREKTDNTLTYDGTFFMNYNGLQWSEAELIVEDPENQQIVIDQYNRPHIIDTEKTTTGYQMVHYRKIDNEWIGYIIDSTTNFCHPGKLIFNNNVLYLIYHKDFIPIFPDDTITFCKYDIATKIEELQSSIGQLLIYPNPARNKVTIEFELFEIKMVNIIISDFYGRHIKSLVNIKIEKGKHKITWDGKNEHKIKVNSGLYLCRVYAGRNVITKSIEIIK